PRRDSNPHGACAPRDFRTTIAFATCPAGSLWSGRCLLPAPDRVFRREPSRLYTLPAARAGRPALARRCHQPGWKGLPTLTPFTRGFPARVLNSLSPLCLPFHHAAAARRAGGNGLGPLAVRL